jgi:hypothetical protein
MQYKPLFSDEEYVLTQAEYTCYLLGKHAYKDGHYCMPGASPDLGQMQYGRSTQAGNLLKDQWIQGWIDEKIEQENRS